MIKDERTKVLEFEFFAKRFGMSYSSLNKLLYSPTLFYKDYVLKQREDITTSSLLQGKIIHCLLLDDGSFDKQFVLLPGTAPSDNIVKVISAVFEKRAELVEAGDSDGINVDDLGSYQDLILEKMKEMNYYQNLSKDEDRVKKNHH